MFILVTAGFRGRGLLFFEVWFREGVLWVFVCDSNNAKLYSMMRCPCHFLRLTGIPGCRCRRERRSETQLVDGKERLGDGCWRITCI